MISDYGNLLKKYSINKFCKDIMQKLNSSNNYVENLVI